MYYTIYKTTNLITGQFYIGKHQTDNLNDEYIGSGKYIKSAIEKYGKNCFSKEILFVFDNEDEMNKKEKDIITEEFVLRKDTYNLGIGGEGGPHFKGKHHTKETIEKIRESRTGSILSEETRQKIKQNNILTNESRGRKTSIANKGKPKSDEHKQKIRESLLKRKI
jgi:hypothetical protein